MWEQNENYMYLAYPKVSFFINQIEVLKIIIIITGYNMNIFTIHITISWPD